MLAHNKYSMKDWMKVSRDISGQSELGTVQGLDNACVEACVRWWVWCHRSFSSSTEQSTSSRLMRRHRRRRRKTKPPRMERVRWLKDKQNHIYVCKKQLSVLDMFHERCLRVPLCLSFLFCLSLTVVLLQQYNWLHHVSEHHHCHFKHGWVPRTAASVARLPSRCSSDEIFVWMVDLTVCIYSNLIYNL